MFSDRALLHPLRREERGKLQVSHHSEVNIRGNRVSPPAVSLWNRPPPWWEAPGSLPHRGGQNV